MPTNFERILAQLQSNDIAQRSAAVMMLQPGDSDTTRAIQILVDVLCTDDDLNIIEDATWVLAQYGTSSTPFLLEKITDDNPQVRQNIVHTLGKIKNQEAVPAIILRAQDITPSVRQKAVYVLGQIGSPNAIEQLISSLDDSVEDVRWSALEALGRFGKTRLGHLIEALANKSSMIREMVASLLGDIGDKRTVEPLLAALETNEWEVRFAVLEALGNIGDKRASYAVRQCLTDEHPAVRQLARHVIEQLETTSS